MGLQAKTVPDVGRIILAGLMAMGAELKTALASSKMRLFKSEIVSLVGITKALLEASEADYDGYTPGGVTVTAFNDPFKDDNGSVLVTSPVTQFNFVDADPTEETNIIGGAWLEDAAGIVRAVVLFDDAEPMETNDNSIPVVLSFRIGEVPEVEE